MFYEVDYFFPILARGLFLKLLEKALLVEFQDSSHGGHLVYGNGTIFVICISRLPQCLPQSFGSISDMVRQEMLFEELQDGHNRGHLGY